MKKQYEDDLAIKLKVFFVMNTDEAETLNQIR